MYCEVCEKFVKLALEQKEAEEYRLGPRQMPELVTDKNYKHITSVLDIRKAVEAGCEICFEPAAALTSYNSPEVLSVRFVIHYNIVINHFALPRHKPCYVMRCRFKFQPYKTSGKITRLILGILERFEGNLFLSSVLPYDGQSALNISLCGAAHF